MHAFTQQQLTAAAQTLGGEVRFSQPLPADLRVMSGAQHVHELDNGLVLYLSRSEDLVDASSQHLLGAGIMAAFLLEGQAEIDLGSQHLSLDAQQPKQRAMLLNLTQAEHFQRHWRNGRKETKVCLGFTPQWLNQFARHPEQCGRALQQFADKHQKLTDWTPSPLLVQHAHQLLRPSKHSVLLQRLQHEAFALEMAADILEHLEQLQQPPHSPHLQRCVQRLQQWIIEDQIGRRSIQQMAHELGTNAVDLQRAFRQQTDSSIAAYIRQQRLAQAYQAIVKNQLSLEQVALEAGYEHLSSFSAAFKRQYGTSPSQLRR